jgi:hypothetical protein
MLDKRLSADLEDGRTILQHDTHGRSHDAQNNRRSAHSAHIRHRGSAVADFNRGRARTDEDATSGTRFFTPEPPNGAVQQVESLLKYPLPRRSTYSRQKQ